MEPDKADLCAFLPVRYPLLVAYVLYWLPHSVIGVAVWLVILMMIYAAIWCVAYFSAKRKIQKINDLLHRE